MFKFYNNEGELLQECRNLAFLYDELSGSGIVLHKHGEVEKIEELKEEWNESLKKTGLFMNLLFKVIDVSEWSVEEINKCIQCSDYFNEAIKKS